MSNLPIEVFGMRRFFPLPSPLPPWKHMGHLAKIWGSPTAPVQHSASQPGLMEFPHFKLRIWNNLISIGVASWLQWNPRSLLLFLFKETGQWFMCHNMVSISKFELLSKMIGARNENSIFLDEKPSWKKKTFESTTEICIYYIILYIYTLCHMYIFLQVASRHFEPTSIDLPTISKNGIFLPTTSNE